MTHQYMPKIFHGLHKTPAVPLLQTSCTVPKLSSDIFLIKFPATFKRFNICMNRLRVFFKSRVIR